MHDGTETPKIRRPSRLKKERHNKMRKLKEKDGVAIMQEGNELIIVTPNGNYKSNQMGKLLRADMKVWSTARILLAAVQNGETDADKDEPLFLR